MKTTDQSYCQSCHKDFADGQTVIMIVLYHIYTKKIQEIIKKIQKGLRRIIWCVIVNVSLKDTKSHKKRGDSMNPNKLRAVMALHGDTGKVLSEVLNVTQSRFSAKLTGRGGAQFTQGEIQAIKDRYDLSAKQVDDIFFDVRVS